MKKIIILGLMFAGFTVTSCKKYLDIQPKQTVGNNLVVTSLSGLQSCVVGAFNALQSGNLYGGGIIANTELWADYIYTGPISDFSLSQFRSHQFNGYNAEAGGLWGDAYNAILIANTVLKYLPNFEAQNPAQCKLIAAQCYFVRAVMHYELVREFAQPSGFTSDDSHLGVPIVLVPAADAFSGQSTPRSTVAQVYTQVISDLMRADSSLPAVADYSTTFVSKYAAEAFLAKAWFSQTANGSAANYALTKTYCDKVVAGGFSLDPNTASIDSDQGNTAAPEAIFQIVNILTDNTNGNLNGRFSIPEGAAASQTTPIYLMNTNFVTILFNAKAIGDKRYSQCYAPSLFVSSEYFCQKYKEQVANVTIVRLGEILLTRAECEAQAGNTTAALSDLNMIRARAGIPPISAASAGAVITAIRAERDFELAMEGDHYFEIKRRKGVFNTPFAGTLQWNDPTMVYPIPYQEMNQNKNMVQNPGY